MEADVDWAVIGCAVGSSEHIPTILTELTSKDEGVRERAFMTLAHDLAWNENVYEATPYAICQIVHTLANVNTPDPTLMLTLLRRLGNAESSHPEVIQWRGAPVQLARLCRQLLEAHLDLYINFLEDPKSRVGALDVITSFRLNAAEAEEALEQAMKRETSRPRRIELTEGISDLQEWNQEPQVTDKPPLPGEYLEEKLARSRDVAKSIAELRSGNATPVAVNPLSTLRSRFIGVAMRTLRRD